MPLPVEEIISRFVDARNDDRPEPVDAFLDRLGELDPQTKAGLRRLLFTLDALAPLLAAQSSAQTSWRRLETILENAAPASSLQDTVLQSGAPPTAPDKTPSRPGRVYTRPATVAPQQRERRPGWLGAVAAAVIAFVLLAALVLVFNSGQNPANPAPQPGASATPLGVLTPTSGYPYQVKVSQVAADGNLIILNYQAYDPALAGNGAASPLLDTGGDVELIAPDGTSLPKMESMYSADGNQQTFDASRLNAISSTLTLRLLMNLDVIADNPLRHSMPAGLSGVIATQAAQSALTPTALPGHIAIDRPIQLLFDPRRRITAPHLTTSGRGVPLTLDRVVTTASETRFYFRGRLYGTQLPTLLVDGQLLSMGAGFSALSSQTRDSDGETVMRMAGDLLNKASPWALTLPEATSDAAPANGSSTWVGPWIFYFAMPNITTSLTPGPLPSLPPATARPTDLPGAVPTYQVPLSGPVPPTASPESESRTPMLPSATATPPLPTVFAGAAPTTAPAATDTDATTASPTTLGAATVTEAPTPAIDLAALTQRSTVIVRGQLSRTVSPTEQSYFEVQVSAWLKRPANLIAATVTFHITTNEEGPTIFPQAISSGDDNDMMFFLEDDGFNPMDRASKQYVLTDPSAAAFAVSGDQIKDAGLPQYNGWSVDRFLSEVAAPTPVAVTQPEHDLALLGESAYAIVDAQPPDTAPLLITTTVGLRYMANFHVNEWLKDPNTTVADAVGVAMAPSEYDFLMRGSKRYILYLRRGDDSETFDDYYPLQDGLSGVFEVSGNSIGFAGIRALSGQPLQQFRNTLLNITPQYPPEGPPEADYGDPLVSIKSSPGVALLQLGAQQNGSETAFGEPFAVNVQSWIKKPANLAGDQFDLLIDPLLNNQFVLGPGPYIVFLNYDPKAPSDWQGPTRFLPIGVYGIRNNLVEYGYGPRYRGWPVEQFIQALKNAMH